jgi:hypothetical protein
VLPRWPGGMGMEAGAPRVDRAFAPPLAPSIEMGDKKTHRALHAIV